MYVSLLYRLWKILLSNMSRPETFGMTLVYDCFTLSHCEILIPGIYIHVNLKVTWGLNILGIYAYNWFSYSKTFYCVAIDCSYLRWCHNYVFSVRCFHACGKIITLFSILGMLCLNSLYTVFAVWLSDCTMLLPLALSF